MSYINASFALWPDLVDKESLFGSHVSFESLRQWDKGDSAFQRASCDELRRIRTPWFDESRYTNLNTWAYRPGDLSKLSHPSQPCAVRTFLAGSAIATLCFAGPACCLWVLPFKCCESECMLLTDNRLGNWVGLQPRNANTDNSLSRFICFGCSWAFTIWGAIFALQGIGVAYQAAPQGYKNDGMKQRYVNGIGKHAKK